MIQCPQCDVSMRQVTARAIRGSLIQLDQCAECGRIWCDKWELFPGRSETASINSDGKGRHSTARDARPDLRLSVIRFSIRRSNCSVARNVTGSGSIVDNSTATRIFKSEPDRKNVRGDPGRELPDVYQDPKSWVVLGPKNVCVS